MAQTTLTARIDPIDKKNFEAFCSTVGLTVSSAINLYVKAVLQKQKLPFEISADPFYNEENLNMLRQSIKQAQNGQLASHELIEV
ncbi:type II toxin-antitoxin system RelB/DinJ family antitoxin [Veillonellaceae bacterium WCA-693-APC-5D-A]|uniref:Type II toxin-antitoxin system RelB/DinJ family antitoxin n=1 Tax=Anaerovibrio slackiae TaxID=2652309 RepID=A0A6I2UJ16_9FIRM|nr:type II toxin-antitoxin system RelB/DinJ family antitoxin [Anaerovibrio slackiae]MCI6097948.1 type II toxin-antitoxin system RelB/DinJ family antitoxin [Selenomonadaceae bacterium]MSU09564.1 type II toxin-antitoxin system RelB/DinJ family antitoxin [Anaerovibrio slackiae]